MFTRKNVEDVSELFGSPHPWAYLRLQLRVPSNGTPAQQRAGPRGTPCALQAAVRSFLGGGAPHTRYSRCASSGWAHRPRASRVAARCGRATGAPAWAPSPRAWVLSGAGRPRASHTGRCRRRGAGVAAAVAGRAAYGRLSPRRSASGRRRCCRCCRARWPLLRCCCCRCPGLISAPATTSGTARAT